MDGIKIMVNGIPGNMAVNVATHAIKDNRSIKIGMIASSAFAILIGGSAYFIGATTRYFFTSE